MKRPRNTADEFENAVERALGQALRAEAKGKRGATIGDRLWASLAESDWTHTNGDTASYSWRDAGDMIAAVIDGEDDYLRWYDCDMPCVYEDILTALAGEGWAPVGRYAIWRGNKVVVVEAP